MSTETWQIWLANVRFEDSPEIKKRPVLILQNAATYVLALKMTSQPPRPGEYIIKDWQTAGLKKETTVRIDKLLKLSPNTLCHKIGKLSFVDIANLQQILSE